MPKLVDDYMAKKMMVDEFVSFDLPMEKINEAFDLMHAGKRYVTVFQIDSLVVDFFFIRVSAGPLYFCHSSYQFLILCVSAIKVCTTAVIVAI